MQNKIQNSNNKDLFFLGFLYSIYKGVMPSESKAAMRKNLLFESNDIGVHHDVTATG